MPVYAINSKILSLFFFNSGDILGNEQHITSAVDINNVMIYELHLQ